MLMDTQVQEIGKKINHIFNYKINYINEKNKCIHSKMKCIKILDFLSNILVALQNLHLYSL